MTTKRAERPTLTRAGLASVLLGAALALSALGAPANAAPKDREHKVTICHRTNSVSNPYIFNTIDVDGSNGSLGNGNNDHTHHLGPAFDFSADPAVAYPPPHNGDQWGDIIPPYQWDGGSFPGLNWDANGQAIYANGCTAPVPCGPNDTACEPPPCQPSTDNNQCTPCPEGQTPTGRGGCNPPPCTPSSDNNQCTPCPEGQTPTGQGGCTPPACVPSNTNNQCTPCPEGQTPTGQGACTTPSPGGPGEQATPPGTPEVLGNVVTPTPKPAVQATQVRAATLPRTGRNSGALAEVGLGLVLLGIGALLAGRRDERLI